MGNLNPYYNESFVFIVVQEMLRVGTTKFWHLASFKLQNENFFNNSFHYSVDRLFSQMQLLERSIATKYNFVKYKCSNLNTLFYGLHKA